MHSVVHMCPVPTLVYSVVHRCRVGQTRVLSCIYIRIMSCISLCFNAVLYLTFLIEVLFHFANIFAADYIVA